MELKYKNRTQMFSASGSFNRTFMELKFVTNFKRLIRIHRFNRTFMELKLATAAMISARAQF